MKLEDLKKQNEAEEAALLEADGKKPDPVIDDNETVDVDPDENAETTDSEDLSIFMDADEQTSEKDKKTDDQIPLAAHLKVKSKIKDYKGEIAERDKEVDRLRAERDALKKPDQKPEAINPPLPEDFDTDDEYKDALNEYIDTRTTENINRSNHQGMQEKEQAKILENIDKGVDDHYTRVKTLCHNHKIKADTYKAAESRFKNIVESAFPGKGDFISKAMIADIGKGSGSVVLSIGINEAEGNRFLSLLNNDPNGTRVPMYLGELKAKLKLKQSGIKVSQARSPGTVLKGDAPNVNNSADKRKYDALHAKGEGNAAFKIKRAAKAKGADTSSW